MKKTKEAKFFCESCGSEVPKNAKVCNTCGKFFASVRCPQCGRTGNTEDFTNGCPTCGYAVSDGNNTLGVRNKIKGSENIKNNRNYKNKDMSFFSSFGNSKDSGKNQGDSSLPVWIYIVCVIVLVLLVVVLYSCL